VAARSAWFERTLFSLEVLEPPGGRFVSLRYQRFDHPISLPMTWDDAARQRSRRFDLFYPSLLEDLP
jgi:hypothetical protein